MEPDCYDPIAAALEKTSATAMSLLSFSFPETLHASGRIVAHEKAVVAGTRTAAEVFRHVDPATDVQIVCPRRRSGAAGDILIEVRGLARSILKAERVALNFLAAPLRHRNAHAAIC